MKPLSGPDKKNACRNEFVSTKSIHGGRSHAISWAIFMRLFWNVVKAGHPQPSICFCAAMIPNSLSIKIIGKEIGKKKKENKCKNSTTDTKILILNNSYNIWNYNVGQKYISKMHF